jgi:hypothetical protein
VCCTEVFCSVTYCTVLCCTAPGNNGDYEEASDSEDDGSEDGEGEGEGVNILRAHSMGCAAEEVWKR